MNIGILTFHSQLNYGGVLQCWALNTALERMGADVVIIDRWHDTDNTLLERKYNTWGRRQWIKFWIRSLLGLGDINLWLRVRRTKKFLKQHIKKSPYHFVEWKDSPKELGIDALVVGSDQVWHCGDWGDPRVYLLKDAPHMYAISYAASFGMTALPATLGNGAKEAANLSTLPIYKEGLSRFKRISCREQEGVSICKSLGFDAAHVVDPTLLAWGKNAERKLQSRKSRELVCYFLSENIDEHLTGLNDFAKRNRCKIKVFVDAGKIAPSQFPANLAKMKSLLKKWISSFASPVKIMESAGPEEFLSAFRDAQWVLSDSFHALMFSICNGCNARMIRPSTETRRKMFARIEEFASHTEGPLVVNSVLEALNSFARNERVIYDYDWIEDRRSKSEAWLKESLG